MLQRLAKPAPQPPPARPLPGKRRPLMLAASVAVIALGAVGAWEVYGVATHQTPVLVMANDIPLGQVLQQQDLRTVAMGMDPSVQSFTAGQRSMVIGKRAAVDLRAGSLLAPSQITDSLVPAPGQVVVPVAVRVSQLPARGIQPGDRVVATVVLTDAQGQQARPADHPAQVDRVGQADADGLMVVDLLVPATDGTSLARQAASGKVALVLQSKAG
ncbi:SAF domain-containing protein [Nonomuraea sp. NPDC050556]|uniref:SAF domain-containing protein n=1 Tax=Nonomuraea sp. NPDC050556 TaxID=3364369 RepID=UPI0037BDC040